VRCVEEVIQQGYSLVKTVLPRTCYCKWKELQESVKGRGRDNDEKHDVILVKSKSGKPCDFVSCLHGVSRAAQKLAT
jgi:hypothetical protein